MIENLFRRTTRRKLRSNTTLFTTGSKVEFVFLLLSGAARTFVYPANGKLVTLYRVNPGELLGDDQVARNSYRYSAIMEETGVFTMVDRTQFLNEYSSVKPLLSQVSQRVGKLVSNIERLAIPSAHLRVLSYLQFLRDQNGGNVVNIRRRACRFSDDLNLSPEAIYRALAKLEKEQAINRLADGSVQLLND